MGEVDTKRQALNVFRMELMGAKVIPVKSGTRTLKDAINEALRDWVANVHDTHYLIGSVVGPHPFPLMVRDFQSVIGKETRAQIVKKEGKSLKETELIRGIIVDKEVIHDGMPKKLKNAKIALLNAAIEIEKTEIDAEIRIKTPDGVKAFLDQETEMLKKMVVKIIAQL